MVRARSMIRFFLVVAMICFGCGDGDEERAVGGKEESTWIVHSPDGKVTITVGKRDLGCLAGYPHGDHLYYKVDLDGIEVLEWAPLGIECKDRAFVLDLTPVGETGRAVDEIYEMPVGKQRLRVDRCNETTLRFENEARQGVEGLR